MIDYNRVPIRSTNDEDAYNLFEKIKNQSGLVFNDEFEYVPNLFGFNMHLVIDRGGYIIDNDNFIIFSENVQQNVERLIDISILYFTNYHNLERLINRMIARIENDETSDCSKFKLRYYAHPDVSVEQLELFGFKAKESNLPLYEMVI